MIEKLKQYYTDWKLRNVLKREFSPTQDEMNTARNAFMLHAGFMPKVRTSTKIVFLRYSLTTVAVVILLNGVATIYADTTDVPPTHPLYEYKLLAEEVKVRTAPAYKRPELEAKLVEKRIKELATLSKASTPVPTSPANPSTPATSTVSTSTVAVHHPNPHIEATVKQNLKMYLDAVYNANKQNNKGNKHGNSQKQWLKQQAFCTSDLQSVALLNNSEDNKEITQKIMHLCNSKSQQGDTAGSSTSTPTTTPITNSTTTQSTSTDVGVLIPSNIATSTSHTTATTTHQTTSTTSNSTINTNTNGDDYDKKNPSHRNRRFEIQPSDFQF